MTPLLLTWNGGRSAYHVTGGVSWTGMQGRPEVNGLTGSALPRQPVIGRTGPRRRSDIEGGDIDGNCSDGIRFEYSGK